MIYTKILCIGDSQTFGARSYGSYPIYLSELLEKSNDVIINKSKCYFPVVNKSVNGYTARDLYFKLNYEIGDIEDVFLACLMIGTNDCHKKSNPQLYKSYLKQIILTLKTRGIKVIYFGLIPKIYQFADPWYQNYVQDNRDTLNKLIEEVCKEFSGIHAVNTDMPIECYEDSVHFNEEGNLQIAQKFAVAITNTSQSQLENSQSATG